MDLRTQLQNALRGNHVPELVRMQLRPVLKGNQEPVIRAGDQALVSHVRRSDGRDAALRSPISPDIGADWPERYPVVVQGLPAAARSLLPREIEVLPNGITLGRRRLPAIVMEWISGPTVLQAADRAASAGRVEVLTALAASLKDLWEILRDTGVSHGDLAADNLMVREDGDLVLVDLDRLSWRGGPKAATEGASAAYRLPGPLTTAVERDAFSVLVQYVSLTLLAEAPDLRESFGDSPTTHGGALLFSSWDITDPSTSSTFPDVRSRVTGVARDMVDQFRGACLGHPNQVPDILADVMGVARSKRASAEPEQRGFPEAGWDLSRVIERMRLQDPASPDAPARPLGEFAQEQRETRAWTSPESLDEDRKGLAAAVARGDEADIIRLATRLANDPIAQLYKVDVERILAAGYDARISRAVSQQRDEAVVSLAREADARRLPLSPSSRRAVRRIQERGAVQARLETALREDRRADLADLAVSGELVVLGDTDRATLQRVLQALEWPLLQQALETDDDALILEAFDEELFEGEAAVPDRVRERIDLARARRSWLAEVRTALKSRDVERLGHLFSSEPEGAANRLSAGERNRALRMMERETAIRGLAEAIGTGNDAQMLKSLQEVQRVGARIEDRQMWTSIRRVVERASVVEQIVEAGSADPIDDRALARLLPVARMMGLRHDPALVGDLAWDRLNSYVVRAAAARRIRRAIATDDDRVIRWTAYPDPAGAIRMLSAAERARVEASRE